jgi:transcriptional regulator with XRE-family HTH domain
MQTTQLVDALKRELKARGINYATVAEGIGMSEATVKRMLSTRNLTLERLDEILEATGIKLQDLLRVSLADEDTKLISELSDKQEREIVANPALFATAVACMNLMRFDEILDLYALTEAQLVGMLTKLDKMGLIELAPANRIRVKVARTFRWIPNGPIMQFFRIQAQEYFSSSFHGTGEKLILVNSMLTRATIEKFIERMHEVAREFSRLHTEDTKYPIDRRHAHSLILAVRPWEPSTLRPLRRRPDQVR